MVVLLSLQTHQRARHPMKRFEGVRRREVVIMKMAKTIDHFTVVYSVTWPLNGSEAGGDLAFIQTSLLLLSKYT